MFLASLVGFQFAVLVWREAFRVEAIDSILFDSSSLSASVLLEYVTMSTAEASEMSVKQQEDEASSKKRRVNAQDCEEAKLCKASATAVLLVNGLLDPKRADKTIDALRSMDLWKEENASALREFSRTTVCANVVQAMVMKQNSGVEFQMKCCDFVHALFQSDDRYKVGFLKAGAVKAIVLALEKFPRHEQMQSIGVMTLSVWVTRETKKFIEAGGIDLVLVAMKRFPANEIIQNCGCFGLMGLSKQNYTNTELLVESGTINVILSSMVKLRDHDGVQLNACKCLYNLADNEKARNLILENKGAITLSKTQFRFRGKDERIEKYAREALLRVLEERRSLDAQKL
jgi:hypothetical protein